MKVTAITPNNFAKVCVASGIIPEAALDEELPDGWFWKQESDGAWIKVNEDGDTPEFLAFERMGRDMMTGEAWALDPETGEWEQI